MILTRHGSGVGLDGVVTVGVAATVGDTIVGSCPAGLDAAVVGAANVGKPIAGSSACSATVGKTSAERHPVAATNRKRQSSKVRERVISCTVCGQLSPKMDRKPGKQ
jgi:hypothetical protein